MTRAGKGSQFRPSVLVCQSQVGNVRAVPHEDQRRRLARLMNARRVDLHLKWETLAKRAGLTYEGLRVVRDGDRPMLDLTKAGIEDGLEWDRGSIDAILNGGEPTISVRATPATVHADAHFPAVGVEVNDAAHVARRRPPGAEEFVDVSSLTDEQLTKLLADLATENARRRATE